MRVCAGLFALVLLAVQTAAAPPAQVPLSESFKEPLGDVQIGKKRPLHGRFLHITGESYQSYAAICSRI